MEFTLDIIPPTVTAQEHKIRIVHGRPMFYDTLKLKAARAAFESLLIRLCEIFSVNPGTSTIKPS